MSRRGFSMAEMLIVCAIFMIPVAMAAQFLSVGVRGYSDIAQENKAQLLCRELSTAVRDQLAYVTYIEGAAYSEAGGAKHFEQPYFLSKANTVQGVPAQFVMKDQTGNYASNQFGFAVLRYPTSSTDYYYYPVSESAYEGGGDEGYEAKVEYTYYPEHERFDVKITVKYVLRRSLTGTAGVTAGAERQVENEFIVVPMMDVTVTNTGA